MADEIVKKRTRPDRKEALSVHTEPGDNRKYLEHSMVMLDWPDVNVRESEQVKERMGMYFALCAQDDMKPSVAGMALAFGVDRKTIWAWANGVDSKTLPAESRNLIKKGVSTFERSDGKLYAEREDQSGRRYLPDEEQHGLCGQAGGRVDTQPAARRSGSRRGLGKKYLEDVAGASSDYDPED